MTPRKRIVLAAGIGLLAACSRQKPADDESSVRTYQTDVDPFRKLAADTGPELCQASRGCELGDHIGLLVAHGNDVIIGSMSGEVLQLDSAGQTVTPLARRGKGPGEFMWPGAGDFDTSGKLHVVDVALRRMVVFDKNLRAEKTAAILLPTPPDMMVQIMVRGGRVYAVLAKVAAGDSTEGWVATAGDGSQPFRRLAASPAALHLTEGGRRVRNPGMFGPRVFYDMDRQGNVIYVSGERYAIHRIRPDGSTSAILEVVVRADATTKADIDAELANRLQAVEGLKQLQGPPGVPMPDMRAQARAEARLAADNASSVLPVVDALRVLDDGSIWVRRFNRPTSDEARWDGFTQSGEIIGSLQLPASSTIRAGDAHAVLVQGTNDLGEASIRRIRIN